MNNNILEINNNFEEIKTLFIELEENLTILTIGNLVSMDDIKDIQKNILDLEEKIKKGKEHLSNYDLDKKNDINKIYNKYEFKINKIKELFSKHFLYE